MDDQLIISVRDSEHCGVQSHAVNQGSDSDDDLSDDSSVSSGSDQDALYLYSWHVLKQKIMLY